MREREYGVMGLPKQAIRGLCTLLASTVMGVAASINQNNGGSNILTFGLYFCALEMSYQGIKDIAAAGEHLNRLRREDNRDRDMGI